MTDTAELRFHNPYYYLGCPIWNCAAWKGKVYPVGSQRDHWLKHYSAVFGTVEGNSTFYGLPSIETFQKWAKESAPGFQFCLKIPGQFTHQQQLTGNWEAAQHFLQGLEILSNANRLGPTLVQLPPTFGLGQLPDLLRFLDTFPETYPLSVEVRHPDWFLPDPQSILESELETRGVDRVIFDSRPLYSLAASDESERQSQNRKPKLPVTFSATGPFPILRLIGRNRLEEIEPWFDQWIAVIAHWVKQGRKPFVFTHTPDDQFAPEFAMALHNALSQKLSNLTPVTQWPHQPPVQGMLF